MTNSESPYKRAMDGPSRQLLWELGRLQILDREAFQSRLDRESKEKEALHNAALAAAAARHEQIWKEAEFERKRVLMEAEEEQQRRLKMKEEQLEQLRRRTAEGALELKRQREETARRIEAEKVEEARILAEIAEKQRRLARERAEAKQKADAEAAEQAAKQAAEQAAGKKDAAAKEEAERRTAETDKKAKETTTATQAIPEKESPKIPQLSQSSRPSPLDPESHISPVNRAEHVKYLAIHQRSKDLRKWMEAQWAQNASVKEQMGEIRRKIRKCVGQLTDKKGANTASLKQIRDVLLKAISVSDLKIDATEFIAYPPPNMTDKQAPACLVFQLIYFSKYVVAQLCDEASRNASVAEPIGTIASQIFSYPELQLNGISFIDIIIAKFHIVCPLLFGVYCEDMTPQGRVKMGWRKDGVEGAYLTEAQHFDRMEGLGAGFGTLTTRNYDKSRFVNPCPPYHFWRAVASIINVPPHKVTRSHLIVLRSMISGNEVRIVELFGDAGRLLLQKALVAFPAMVEKIKKENDWNLGEAQTVGVLTSVTEAKNKLFL